MDVDPTTWLVQGSVPYRAFSLSQTTQCKLTGAGASFAIIFHGSILPLSQKEEAITQCVQMNLHKARLATK